MSTLSELLSPLNITITILVAILGIIAAYFIIRMMKGKIEIRLPKRGFNSGEPITGDLTLITRKTLPLNRFYVALIGYQIVESVDSDGDRKTRKNEFYRNEVNLADGGSIPAG